MASTNVFSVPVLEINMGNFTQVWPSLLLAIKSSTFVAIDTEMSGLGNRRQLFAKSVDDRYKAMSECAKTRSIISLGLSCFKLLPKPTEPGSGEPGGVQENCDNYRVQTFNILMLCSENYVVEPLSLKFLVDHGFDFNKQHSTGLPYYRGTDKKEASLGPSIRELMSELVQSNIPLVFHNALMDLVFLYENLYASLPANMSTFLADLAEMFPGGLYDTKYITEFEARFPASYLEYVFRKSQRENHTRQLLGHTSADMSFLSYPDGMTYVAHIACPLLSTAPSSDRPAVKAGDVCLHFASHGWCAQGTQCAKSHDIDDILDTENCSSAKKRKKRHRKKKAADHEKGDWSDEQEELQDGSETDEPTVEIPAEPPTSAIDSDLQTPEVVPEIVSENPVNNNLTEKDNLATEAESNGQRHTISIEGGHRAGFDAFMTGFAFAFFAAKLGKTDNNGGLGLEKCTNKVALGGKDFPLQVVKSTFAKTSRIHREKLQQLKN